MDTTNETPVSPAELLALIKEAVDSLSDGFAVLDAKHRLIFANDVSHRSFGSAFGLYARGLGLRDAMLAGVRRERPDLDDATANAVADGLTKRLLSGKPTDLASDDGKIVQTTYRRMSGGRMATVSVDINHVASAREGTERRQDEGRSRQPRQVRLPRQHQSRDPHAAQRHVGHGASVGRGRFEAGPERASRGHSRIRQVVDVDRQRRLGLGESRGGAA